MASDQVDSVCARMFLDQKRYRKRFNKKVGSNRASLKIGSFVFSRREHVQRGIATHKLALIADGPCEVSSMDDTNVAVRIGNNVERVSRDRVITFSTSDN